MILWFSRRCRPVFDPCRDLADRLLARRLLRNGSVGCTCGKLAAVTTPVGGLRHDDSPGFVLWYCLKTSLVRYRKNPAGLQPVHVATIECVLVGLEEPNQHLVKRYPLGPEVTGDLAERFAATHLVGLAAFRRLFGGPRPAVGVAALGPCDGALFGERPWRHQRPGDRWRSSGLASELHRIEEERVLPNHATGRPVEFQQQIDEGVVDRPLRSQPDDRLPIRALVDGEADAQQGRRIFHASLLEGIRRRQLRPQTGKFFARRKELHLRAQRLTDRREDGDLAQTGSGCGQGQSRDRQG